ncbi:hypothetical protein DSO57_1019265 [Entomophthora muscae]|uniref:Uncharacterized protein n=1 Tax=Entomophthora muscae TaxID=34485 RepID=A0ACC2UQ71_9FUNG|nr:hypothetical protein DSO57_1019265 [Entomophthora muscae]
MDCNEKECFINSNAANNTVELASENETTESYVGTSMRFKSQLLLEKLKIKNVLCLERKRNVEDDFAEPEFVSKEIDFKPLTKYLAIYFTASWCTPCREFAPALESFINDHNDEISLLVASSDSEETPFKDYISGKDWPYIDLSAKETISGLQKRFGIALLPSLAILNIETCKLVTTWGREAISYNSENCLSDWDSGDEGFHWWHFFKFRSFF